VEKGEQVKVRFNPGQIVMTPGAISAMAEAGHTPSEFLKRHICGDWGKLDTHDTKANDSAMKTGLRLLSSYETKGGETLWVITEAVDIERGDNPKQRQLTTLLLPSEY
jgi:hypothetical protein